MAKKQEIQIYSIPVSMRNPTSDGKVPEKIGLKEISSGEEEEAAETAKAAAHLPYKMLRKSMVWVKYENEESGHLIKLGDAEDELIFNSLVAPARTLLIQVFNEMHSPKPEEREAFLSSLEIVSISS